MREKSGIGNTKKIAVVILAVLVVFFVFVAFAVVSLYKAGTVTVEDASNNKITDDAASYASENKNASAGGAGVGLAPYRAGLTAGPARSGSASEIHDLTYTATSHYVLDNMPAGTHLLDTQVNGKYVSGDLPASRADLSNGTMYTWGRTVPNVNTSMPAGNVDWVFTDFQDTDGGATGNVSGWRGTNTQGMPWFLGWTNIELSDDLLFALKNNSGIGFNLKMDIFGSDDEFDLYTCFLDDPAYAPGWFNGQPYLNNPDVSTALLSDAGVWGYIKNKADGKRFGGNGSGSDGTWASNGSKTRALNATLAKKYLLVCFAGRIMGGGNSAGISNLSVEFTQPSTTPTVTGNITGETGQSVLGTTWTRGKNYEMIFESAYPLSFSVTKIELNIQKAYRNANGEYVAVDARGGNALNISQIQELTRENSSVFSVVDVDGKRQEVHILLRNLSQGDFISVQNLRDGKYSGASSSDALILEQLFDYIDPNIPKAYAPSDIQTDLGLSNTYVHTDGLDFDGNQVSYVGSPSDFERFTINLESPVASVTSLDGEDTNTKYLRYLFVKERGGGYHGGDLDIRGNYHTYSKPLSVIDGKNYYVLGNEDIENGLTETGVYHLYIVTGDILSPTVYPGNVNASSDDAEGRENNAYIFTVVYEDVNLENVNITRTFETTNGISNNDGAGINGVWLYGNPEVTVTAQLDSIPAQGVRLFVGEGNLRTPFSTAVTEYSVSVSADNSEITFVFRGNTDLDITELYFSNSVGQGQLVFGGVNFQGGLKIRIDTDLPNENLSGLIIRAESGFTDGVWTADSNEIQIRIITPGYFSLGENTMPDFQYRYRDKANDLAEFSAATAWSVKNESFVREFDEMSKSVSTVYTLVLPSRADGQNGIIRDLVFRIVFPNGGAIDGRFDDDTYGKKTEVRIENNLPTVSGYMFTEHGATDTPYNGAWTTNEVTASAAISNLSSLTRRSDLGLYVAVNGDNFWRLSVGEKIVHGGVALAEILETNTSVSGVYSARFGFANLNGESGFGAISMFIARGYGLDGGDSGDTYDGLSILIDKYSPVFELDFETDADTYDGVSWTNANVVTAKINAVTSDAVDIDFGYNASGTEFRYMSSNDFVSYSDSWASAFSFDAGGVDFETEGFFEYVLLAKSGAGIVSTAKFFEIKIDREEIEFAINGTLPQYVTDDSLTLPIILDYAGNTNTAPFDKIEYKLKRTGNADIIGSLTSDFEIVDTNPKGEYGLYLTSYDKAGNAYGEIFAGEIVWDSDDYSLKFDYNSAHGEVVGTKNGVPSQIAGANFKLGDEIEFEFKGLGAYALTGVKIDGGDTQSVSEYIETIEFGFLDLPLTDGVKYVKYYEIFFKVAVEFDISDADRYQEKGAGEEFAELVFFAHERGGSVEYLGGGIVVSYKKSGESAWQNIEEIKSGDGGAYLFKIEISDLADGTGYAEGYVYFARKAIAGIIFNREVFIYDGLDFVDKMKEALDATKPASTVSKYFSVEAFVGGTLQRYTTYGDIQTVLTATDISAYEGQMVNAGAYTVKFEQSGVYDVAVTEEITLKPATLTANANSGVFFEKDYNSETDVSTAYSLLDIVGFTTDTTVVGLDLDVLDYSLAYDGANVGIGTKTVTLTLENTNNANFVFANTELDFFNNTINPYNLRVATGDVYKKYYDGTSDVVLTDFKNADNNHYFIESGDLFGEGVYFDFVSAAFVGFGAGERSVEISGGGIFINGALGTNYIAVAGIGVEFTDGKFVMLGEIEKKILEDVRFENDFLTTHEYDGVGIVSFADFAVSGLVGADTLENVFADAFTVYSDGSVIDSADVISAGDYIIKIDADELENYSVGNADTFVYRVQKRVLYFEFSGLNTKEFDRLALHGGVSVKKGDSALSFYGSEITESIKITGANMSEIILDSTLGRYDFARIPDGYSFSIDFASGMVNNSDAVVLTPNEITLKVLKNAVEDTDNFELLFSENSLLQFKITRKTIYLDPGSRDFDYTGLAINLNLSQRNFTSLGLYADATGSSALAGDMLTEATATLYNAGGKGLALTVLDGVSEAIAAGFDYTWAFSAGSVLDGENAFPSGNFRFKLISDAFSARGMVSISKLALTVVNKYINTPNIIYGASLLDPSDIEYTLNGATSGNPISVPALRSALKLVLVGTDGNLAGINGNAGGYYLKAVFENGVPENYDLQNLRNADLLVLDENGDPFRLNIAKREVTVSFRPTVVRYLTEYRDIEANALNVDLSELSYDAVNADSSVISVLGGLRRGDKISASTVLYKNGVPYVPGTERFLPLGDYALKFVLDEGVSVAEVLGGNYIVTVVPTDTNFKVSAKRLTFTASGVVNKTYDGVDISENDIKITVNSDNGAGDLYAELVSANANQVYEISLSVFRHDGEDWVSDSFPLKNVGTYRIDILRNVLAGREAEAEKYTVVSEKSLTFVISPRQITLNFAYADENRAFYSREYGENYDGGSSSAYKLVGSGMAVGEGLVLNGNIVAVTPAGIAEGRAYYFNLSFDLENLVLNSATDPKNYVFSVKTQKVTMLRREIEFFATVTQKFGYGYEMGTSSETEILGAVGGHTFADLVLGFAHAGASYEDTSDLGVGAYEDALFAEMFEEMTRRYVFKTNSVLLVVEKLDIHIEVTGINVDYDSTVDYNDFKFKVVVYGLEDRLFERDAVSVKLKAGQNITGINRVTPINLIWEIDSYDSASYILQDGDETGTAEFLLIGRDLGITASVKTGEVIGGEFKGSAFDYVDIADKLEFDFAGLLPGDVIDPSEYKDLFEFRVNGAVDVGEYDIVVSIKDGELLNYRIANAVIAGIKFIVSPKPTTVEITFADGANIQTSYEYKELYKKFGGGFDALSAAQYKAVSAAGGLLNPNDITVTSAQDVDGNYVFTLEYAHMSDGAGGNFALCYDLADNSFRYAYKIIRHEVSVTVEIKTFFSQNITYATKGGITRAGFTETGANATEYAKAYVRGTGGIPELNAEFTAVLEVEDPYYYRLTGNIDHKIEKAPISVISAQSAAELTYGDKLGAVEYALGYPVGVTAVIPDGVLTFTQADINFYPTVATEFVEAVITLPAEYANDFEIANADSKILVAVSVLKKTIELTIANGAEKEYDGTPEIVTDGKVELSDLTLDFVASAGDSVSTILNDLEIFKTAGVSAGEYDLSAQFTSGSGFAGNYELSLVTKKYKITPKTVEFKFAYADGGEFLERGYATDFDGSLSEEYILDGELAAGDVLVPHVIKVNVQENTREYVVFALELAVADIKLAVGDLTNYEISISSNNTVKMKKAAVKLNAELEKTYGDGWSVVAYKSFVADGLISGGATLSKLIAVNTDGKPSVLTTLDDTSYKLLDVGAYTDKVSFVPADESNYYYYLDETAVNLTVVPYAITNLFVSHTLTFEYGKVTQAILNTEFKNALGVGLQDGVIRPIFDGAFSANCTFDERGQLPINTNGNIVTVTAGDNFEFKNCFIDFKVIVTKIAIKVEFSDLPNGENAYEFTFSSSEQYKITVEQVSADYACFENITGFELQKVYYYSATDTGVKTQVDKMYNAGYYEVRVAIANDGAQIGLALATDYYETQGGVVGAVVVPKTISKQTHSVTVGAAFYNGNLQPPNADTVKFIQDGVAEIFGGGVSFSLSSGDFKNAGDYNVLVKVVGADANYNFEYDAANYFEAVYTVSKADNTVFSDFIRGKVGFNDGEFPYNASAGIPSAVPSVILSANDNAVFAEQKIKGVPSVTNLKNAGTYGVRFTFTSPNYDGAVIYEREYKVTKLTETVVVSGYQPTYKFGDVIQIQAVNTNVTGKFYKDGKEILKPTRPGVYSYRVILNDAQNYVLSGNSVYEFEIGKIRVWLESATEPVGGFSFEYGSGGERGIGIFLRSEDSNDIGAGVNVSLEYESNAGEVGSHLLKASISGVNAGEYALETFTGVSYEIVPKIVVVKVFGHSIDEKHYYNAKPVVLTYDIYDLHGSGISGLLVDSTYKNNGVNKGVYDVEISSFGTNYKISDTSDFYDASTPDKIKFNFEIEATALELVVLNSKFTYDGNKKFPVYKFKAGDVLLDSASVPHNALIKGTDAVGAGVYDAEITLIGGNYSGSFPVVQFEIVPALITLALNFLSVEFVYDGSAQSVVLMPVDVTRPLPSDVVVSYKYYKNGAEVPESQVVTAGSYDVLAILTGDNYIERRLSAVMTIKKATLAVNANFEDGKLVVEKIEGAEYSLDGTNWQTENVFDGVSGSNSYSVYVRFADKEIAKNYNTPNASATVESEGTFDVMIILLVFGGIVFALGIASVTVFLIKSKKRAKTATLPQKDSENA